MMINGCFKQGPPLIRGKITGSFFQASLLGVCLFVLLLFPPCIMCVFRFFICFLGDHHLCMYPGSWHASLPLWPSVRVFRISSRFQSRCSNLCSHLCCGKCLHKIYSTLTYPDSFSRRLVWVSGNRHFLLLRFGTGFRQWSPFHVLVSPTSIVMFLP